MFDSRWLHQIPGNSSARTESSTQPSAISGAQTGEVDDSYQLVSHGQDIQYTPWWYEEVQAMNLQDKSIQEIRTLILKHLGLFWIHERDILRMLDSISPKLHITGSPYLDKKKNLELKPLSKQRQARQQAEIKKKHLPGVKVLETRRKLSKGSNQATLPRRSRRIENVAKRKA
ncbi:hypothetical protein BT63DRAFT_460259 [Microthyrium microscopicum]|uniref:Uncharacterized protein n=1 Tax=Microthyrium microscopicum TaxID=703497 RepID=A0A6A6U0W9_9PEZI|nr:hypothetical protein BT63DRAFT_460259 [Microthyrium microscopicum]